MRQRSVEIQLTPELSAALAEAVTAYAHAAFPDGASECAQVSREALLETARGCRAHSGGCLSLRRRQLAQLRAATDWYFSEISDQPNAAKALKGLLARKGGGSQI